MFSRLSTFVLVGFMAVGVVLAAPAASEGVSARQSFWGKATYYFQGGVAGACGQFHSDQDFVVALDTVTYANGAHCGATITITDTNTGVTSSGVVADECPGCGGGSIDLSESLFNVFAPSSDGVFPVFWSF